MLRVASASFVGSLIEFYDFIIYGVAAALVFGKVFFPALGTAAATVAAFATLGVAFIAVFLWTCALGYLTLTVVAGIIGGSVRLLGGN